MAELISGSDVIHKLMPPVNQETTDNQSFDNIDALSKPKLSIKKEETGILIKINKNEAAEVKLFSKRSSEEEFTLLSQVSESYYIDNRPNLFKAPELREYMAYYVKNNKQVGHPSDVTLIIKK